MDGTAALCAKVVSPCALLRIEAEAAVELQQFPSQQIARTARTSLLVQKSSRHTGRRSMHMRNWYGVT